MHEMSLAGGILRVVEDAAQRERFRRVRRLVVEAGALSGVETHALRFALESMAPGTVLDGATIEIDEPAGRAWCLRCSDSVTIASRADPCPRCGGWQLAPTGGTELKVRELIVVDEPAPEAPAAFPVEGATPIDRRSRIDGVRSAEPSSN
jgi:hydrogenase nickel incorporation protein HypA/HybF